MQCEDSRVHGSVQWLIRIGGGSAFWGFCREVRERPFLSVGFGLFWTWVWLVFQTTFFAPGSPGGLNAFLPGWVVPLFAYAMTFVFLGALFKVRGVVPGGKAYRVLIPLSMSLGVALCGLLTFSPLVVSAANVAAMCFGGTLMGAGTACLHVEWGRAFGKFGPRVTILHGVTATLVAAFLSIFVSFLPIECTWVVAFFIPPLCMVLLKRDSPLGPDCAEGSEGVPLRIPKRFSITAFIQGLSFGAVQAILLLGNHGQSAPVCSAASFAIAALALLAFAALFRMDFNQLIYQVGFLTMAVGYLVLSLAGPSNIVGLFIHTMGYRFVDINMWALCVFLISHRGIPVNWTFSVTTCFLLLGQVGGAVAGGFFMAGSPVFGIGESGMAAVMVFVLLASALLMSDRRNLQMGWGMVRPGEMDESSDDFERACMLVCRRYRLTAREKEVFSLLAQGASRAEISEDLTLAKETVKTHVRNIYRKMGVHSQRDVTSIITSEQSGLDACEGGESDAVFDSPRV